MRDRAVLVQIEHDRWIDRKTDSRFMREYQWSILLALKERGVLTEMQFRTAEGKLRKPFGISMEDERGAH